MKFNPVKWKTKWVLLAGIACGAVVWALSVPITGMKEPWDSPGPYYIVAVFISGILAALPAPRYWWAAVIGIFMGERIYAFVMIPNTRLLLLFGIFMGVMTLTWVPAAIGALTVYIVTVVNRRRARRRQQAGH